MRGSPVEILQFIVKTLVSALIIAMIATLSKRLPFIGALIASLPLTSILAMIWLYEDTKDIARITQLSYNVFWLVIPSLIFFVTLPFLLKRNIGFYWSLMGSSIVLIITYFAFVKLLRAFKIDI